ncbi:hypothetical protein C4B60_12095 [Jeotgalibacillus proteolyticus]|uniref:Uncharacterized protein n=1 Tax=Jeotgalibacillus proteolyticus TaxID=2082395 RepID=A0A2S5GBP5_9BACL|nr:hypothetical protein C4B60_12095 [Jeotgalibacillus proteolyticus]
MKRKGLTPAGRNGKGEIHWRSQLAQLPSRGKHAPATKINMLIKKFFTHNLLSPKQKKITRS